MKPEDSLKENFRAGAISAGVDATVYDKLARNVQDMSPCLRSAVHICFYDYNEAKNFETDKSGDSGLPCHGTGSALVSETTKQGHAKKSESRHDGLLCEEDWDWDTVLCQDLAGHQQANTAEAVFPYSHSS